LTAVFTAVALIVLLRVFGLLSINSTVDFRGNRRTVASVQKLQQVWDALTQDYYESADEDKMIESAAAAMAQSLGDVYTVYYTKEEMREFTEQSAGKFYGIGIYIQPGENGRLRVTGFLDGSPALEAGVQVDDVIVSVDGADVRDISDSNKIINMIKGESGVSVSIGFYRPSEDREIVIPIIRREIKTENIFSSVLYTSGAGREGIPVGYIYIKMFDGSASEYFNKHLNSLLDSGIAALIVDLRGNPGGDYNETVKIADRLLGDCVIVYTEDHAGRREYSKSDAAALNMPIRVLVDGGSASASEILAGALKDNGAGVLIGTKTFGKGLVQAVLVLKDGSGLKYTRSRYFTPSGVCIDGAGIEPDIYVEYSGTESGTGADADAERGGENAEAWTESDIQLNAALSDIEKVIDKANYE
jgi:carboxyl-terminal processing protease